MNSTSTSSRTSSATTSNTISRAPTTSAARTASATSSIRASRSAKGFGYAFAAIVLNDPVARDSSDDNGDRRSRAVSTSRQSADQPGRRAERRLRLLVQRVFGVVDSLGSVRQRRRRQRHAGARFRAASGMCSSARRKTRPRSPRIFRSSPRSRPRDPAAPPPSTRSWPHRTSDGSIDAFGTNETHVTDERSGDAALPLYTTITRGRRGRRRCAPSMTPATTTSSAITASFDSRSTATRTVTITVSSSNTNNPDPDFRVYRAGTFVLVDDDPPPAAGDRTTRQCAAGTTYVLDVYDCANGCDTPARHARRLQPDRDDQLRRTFMRTNKLDGTIRAAAGVALLVPRCSRVATSPHRWTPRRRNAARRPRRRSPTPPPPRSAGTRRRTAAPAQPAPDAPPPTEPSAAPKPTRRQRTQPRFHARLRRPSAKMSVAVDLRYSFDGAALPNQPVIAASRRRATRFGRQPQVTVQASRWRAAGRRRR